MRPRPPSLILFSLDVKQLFFQITFIQFVVTAAMAGEISDLYACTHSGTFPVSAKSRAAAEIDREEHEITEIGVERTACFGPCPVYTLIIKSDGSFRFAGDAFERKGKYTGKVRLWRLARLLQYVREIDYFALDERYEVEATDQDTVFTTVLKGDQRKTISNYGNAGPIRLWALQELIDRLLVDAEWDAPK
jgi:hypothetical protein